MTPCLYTRGLVLPNHLKRGILACSGNLKLCFEVLEGFKWKHVVSVADNWARIVTMFSSLPSKTDLFIFTIWASNHCTQHRYVS